MHTSKESEYDVNEPLRLLANAVPDSLPGPGCRALADEQPSETVSDGGEERRHRTQLVLLLELRVQLGQSRGVPEMVQPALQAVDVSLHAGQLALDGEDVIDRDGLAEELAELVPLGREALDARLDVDRLLGDILRRDVARRYGAQLRERVERHVELGLGDAHRDTHRAFVSRLRGDVAAE